MGASRLDSHGAHQGVVGRWYELGVDARQAIIRRMARGAPPKVLACSRLSIPSGRRVRLAAHCVPDAKGNLVLALTVDGKPVVSAVDVKPLPATRDGVVGLPSIRAYPRRETIVPARGKPAVRKPTTRASSTEPQGSTVPWTCRPW